MVSATFRRVTATSLVVALASMAAPAFAAPVPATATATLTGTVFGENVETPLAGATVVVTDASGTKIASQPTGPQGTFSVAGLAAGRQTLALETNDGSFTVATPVTLAPGETRGVHLALKAASEEEKKKKKKGGAYWTAGAKGTMIAVLIGFVGVGALAIDQANKENKKPASASTPEDK